MQVIFYSKYGIFWFQEQGFYLGASDFWFEHGIFDFEQRIFSLEHTWNEKLEIGCESTWIFLIFEFL